MKRIACLALAAAAAALGCQSAQAQEARLRLASFLPGNQSFGIPAKRWVDELNKRGQGILQITMVGPEAVPLPEQPNAVKTGVVDMHSGPPTFYRGSLIEGETMTLSEKSVAQLKQSGAWTFLNKLHADKMNVMLLTGFGDGVHFNVYTNRPAALTDKAKPFEGMVIRTSPSQKAFLETVGARPVVISPTEVYTALERNMVQGYVWPLLGLKDLGWLKLTKYRYDPGFYSSVVNIMINLERWNKLDSRQQRLLNEMSVWMDAEWPKWRAESRADEERFQKEAGVQTVQVGDELRKRAHDAFWAELQAQSPQNVAFLRRLMTN
jgi:TRAP-type C4-dicarboxylate transport system substrate-binding protein